MDGLALLREIKERRLDLPVIMVTAYGDDERRRRASEWGAADFITRSGLAGAAARAGARESCADFRAGVWDFNPKPE
jgi:CheY-like chemotaxis protein